MIYLTLLDFKFYCTLVSIAKGNKAKSNTFFIFEKSQPDQLLQPFRQNNLEIIKQTEIHNSRQLENTPL